MEESKGEVTGMEPAQPTDAEEDRAPMGATEEDNMNDGKSVDAPAGKKPVFKVVPNHSGFAPGVTADNLKDIIRDLEDEEFLEKLNQ